MKSDARLLDIWRQGFLMVLSLLLLVPFYITVVNSFKNRQDIVQNPAGLPLQRLTLQNFAHSAVSPSFNIFKAYGTSLTITVVSVGLLIVISSMMSYVTARSSHPFLKYVYLLLLTGLMIPPQVILIPLVKVLALLGLMFTSQGLILYYMGFYIPFTVFVYTGFIRTLSKELDESARMDGAGPFVIFWAIIFPLLRPATASVIIFLFLWIWNDFLNPLILLGSTKGYTVTTGIYRAVGQYSTNWEDVFSLVVLASLPVLLLYLFMQRQFIAGLTEGSVKG
jgi:raffinose/stachyose/melibiose transport system permease protein